MSSKTSFDLSIRQTPQLLKKRISSTRSHVFITFCTKNRKPSLNNHPSFTVAKEIALEMDQQLDWRLHFLTVMPDHIHLLITLSDQLSLSRTIAKFKSLLRRKLSASVSIKWQPNFYDHRLRSEESLESYAFYMFMNPYKKGIISVNEEWLGHTIPIPSDFSFMKKRIDGKYPQAEWFKMESNISKP